MLIEKGHDQRKIFAAKQNNSPHNSITNSWMLYTCSNEEIFISSIKTKYIR